MPTRLPATALAAGAILTCLSAPVASADDPGTSDDCTFSWVLIEELSDGYYFGDARLQCPVLATVGGRWELDGQEVRRFEEKQGPGEVAVFDDLQPVTRPGQQLCFIVTAWGGDKGRDCLTT
jgi:hypothetical protein